MKQLLFTLSFILHFHMVGVAQTYIHPQAQKFIICEHTQVGYKMRGVEINAIHHFVMNTYMNMRDNGVSYVEVQSKDTVMYPFIGTTLASMGVELRNPDTSLLNSHYLTFANSPTADTGTVIWSIPNTNQYADTRFNGAYFSGSSSIHLTYYNPTTISNSNITTFEMGCGGTSSLILAVRYTSGQIQAWLSSGSYSIAGVNNAQGITTASRAGGNITLARDGSILGTGAAAVTTALFGTLFIGGALPATPTGLPTFRTTRPVTYADFGGTLTSTEVTSSHNAAMQLHTNKQ